MKSAAYIQSWNQKRLSKISFSIRKSRKWTPGKRYEPANRRADIYVFCLFKHTDKETADPMNLSQWVFFTVNTNDIDAYTRSQTSITLNSLLKLARSVDYKSLRDDVLEKAK